MNSETPLICNMGVFSPAQREQHIQTTMQLGQTVQNIEEIERGYQFTFANESALIFKIAEFISNERLCCPFLEFSLHVVSKSKSISLSLNGPIGTQEFLRNEFAEVFS
ncbi:MAG: hypothetical protein AB1649_09760 [Chloroflexota bacterium]